MCTNRLFHYFYIAGYAGNKWCVAHTKVLNFTKCVCVWRQMCWGVWANCGRIIEQLIRAQLDARTRAQIKIVIWQLRCLYFRVAIIIRSYTPARPHPHRWTTTTASRSDPKYTYLLPVVSVRGGCCTRDRLGFVSADDAAVVFRLSNNNWCIYML